MLERLEAALARERRFVSDASHELRTPLAALRTELELALRRPRPPVELEAALRSAAEETERLSRLAESLLVLVRADGGGLPVHRERLRRPSSLPGFVSAMPSRPPSPAGRSRSRPTGWSWSPTVPRRTGLGNLVDDALRYGHGRVRLAALPGNGGLELHVRDRGPGFPREFLDLAFDHFTRADPSRHGPGAGLGLAIVEVIAHAHGGTARAAKRDTGADVWVELPARRRSVRPAGSVSRPMLATCGAEGRLPADRLTVHLDLDLAVDLVGVLDLAVEVSEGHLDLLLLELAQRGGPLAGQGLRVVTVQQLV
jgi:two-component system, OmpR family, sensor kinase